MLTSATLLSNYSFMPVPGYFASLLRPALTSLCVACLSVAATGCVPYSVGTTAHTVPEGEVQSSSTFTIVPSGLEYDTDFYDEYDGSDAEQESVAVPYASAGVRFGVGPDTDVGVYSPGFSGLVVNAKHRFQQAQPGAPLGVALMGGTGVINGGLNAHFEATLIVSGREDLTATPYGGVRFMQTFPLSTESVSDTPTVGPFGGLRLGTNDLGISAEVGVFYDRSALGIRDRDVIVVPSITLHGLALSRVLRGW
jgi:hypothetical protein